MQNIVGYIGVALILVGAIAEIVSVKGKSRQKLVLSITSTGVILSIDYLIIILNDQYNIAEIIVTEVIIAVIGLLTVWIIRGINIDKELKKAKERCKKLKDSNRELTDTVNRIQTVIQYRESEVFELNRMLELKNIEIARLNEILRTQGAQGTQGTQGTQWGQNINENGYDQKYTQPETKYNQTIDKSSFIKMRLQKRYPEIVRILELDDLEVINRETLAKQRKYLMLKNHPDRFTDTYKEKQEKIIVKITEAYDNVEKIIGEIEEQIRKGERMKV